MNDEEKKEESSIEKFAEKLQVKLPKAKEPVGIKIIALFILIGGLSLITEVFTGIFRDSFEFSDYIIRIGGGFLAIVVAYGLVVRMRLSLWLFGFFVLVGLLINLYFTVFWVLVLVYLIYNRRYLNKSVVDIYFEKFNKKGRGRKPK